MSVPNLCKVQFLSLPDGDHLKILSLNSRRRICGERFVGWSVMRTGKLYYLRGREGVARSTNLFIEMRSH